MLAAVLLGAAAALSVAVDDTGDAASSAVDYVRAEGPFEDAPGLKEAWETVMSAALQHVKIMGAADASEEDQQEAAKLGKDAAELTEDLSAGELQRPKEDVAAAWEHVRDGAMFQMDKLEPVEGVKLSKAAVQVEDAMRSLLGAASSRGGSRHSDSGDEPESPVTFGRPKLTAAMLRAEINERKEMGQPVAAPVALTVVRTKKPGEYSVYTLEVFTNEGMKVLIRAQRPNETANIEFMHPATHFWLGEMKTMRDKGEEERPRKLAGFGPLSKPLHFDLMTPTAEGERKTMTVSKVNRAVAEGFGEVEGAEGKMQRVAQHGFVLLTLHSTMELNDGGAATWTPHRTFETKVAGPVINSQEWIEEMNSEVMLKGREIGPSEKNFNLVESGMQVPVLTMGRAAINSKRLWKYPPLRWIKAAATGGAVISTFFLDVSPPFSPLQAFAVAVASIKASPHAPVDAEASRGGEQKKKDAVVRREEQLEAVRLEKIKLEEAIENRWIQLEMMEFEREQKRLAGEKGGRD